VAVGSSFGTASYRAAPGPAIHEIRLLGCREMRELSPDCTILRERFLGFTKSYITIRR
jgi:hypothetical protein